MKDILLFLNAIYSNTMLLLRKSDAKLLRMKGSSLMLFCFLEEPLV